jgi:hypothetical protein
MAAVKPPVGASNMPEVADPVIVVDVVPIENTDELRISP